MAEPPLDTVLAAGIGGTMPEISREEILRQIFGDVGELIDDFTCAVESTVLLHGRLYVTSKFICFYSNLFGLEKKIRIPYSHITSIAKANTALVIPNAIAISTDKKEYVFRSFWDRDDCHRMLSLFLMKYNANDLSRSSIMSMSLSHSPNPPNNSITDFNPLEFIAPEPVVRDNRRSSVPMSRKEGHARGISTTEGASPLTTTNTINPEDAIFDSESGFAPTSSEGVGLDNAAFFELEVTKSRLKLPVITNATLDISLEDFLQLFISENAPYSYQKYHEMVKDNNLVVSLWEEQGTVPTTDETASDSDGKFINKSREIKFFKPVNLPGLASTRGVKVQRLLQFGDHGVIVVSSTRLEDVPAADTFSVDDMLAVHVTTDNKLSVEISFQVSFIKPTFMKFIIERSTNAEMSKWLESFYQHLKKVCEDYKAGLIVLPDVANGSDSTGGVLSAVGSTGMTATGIRPATMPPVNTTTTTTSTTTTNMVEELPSTIFIRPNTPSSSHHHHHTISHTADTQLSTKKRSNSLSLAQQAHTLQNNNHGFFKRLIIEFKELTWTEQCKIIFIIAFMIFLVINYYKWTKMHVKMVQLESKVEMLEKIIQQFM